MSVSPSCGDSQNVRHVVTASMSVSPSCGDSQNVSQSYKDGSSDLTRNATDKEPFVVFAFKHLNSSAECFYVALTSVLELFDPLVDSLLHY